MSDWGTLLRFLVSGVLAVLSDALVYYLLVAIVTPSYAKILSFVSGSVVAFFMGKLFTFKSKQRMSNEVWRFAALYTATLIANAIVHDLVLLVTHHPGALPFLSATATSTTLNFLGQKYFVFRR